MRAGASGLHVPIWNLVWHARGCLIFTESSQTGETSALEVAPCPGSCDTGPDMQSDFTIRGLHSHRLPWLDQPSEWLPHLPC